MKQYVILTMLIIFISGCQNSNKDQGKALFTSANLCAPVTTDRDWYNKDTKAPLFEGLGDLHFAISTKDTLAQRYFDQGLVLAYGFNHAEAARSFYYAIKIDDSCAMAYWGYAYVLGPNYNAGMESDNYELAYNSIQKAIMLSKNNTTEI
jgi:hypothetical protein